MYFGARADKHGRKPVLILAFTGEVFALLWLVMICLSSLYLDQSRR